MLAHYSHVRVEAKRKALDALAGGVKNLGYDTKNDTEAGCLQVSRLSRLSWVAYAAKHRMHTGGMSTAESIVIFGFPARNDVL